MVTLLAEPPNQEGWVTNPFRYRDLLRERFGPGDVRIAKGYFRVSKVYLCVTGVCNFPAPVDKVPGPFANIQIIILSYRSK